MCHMHHTCRAIPGHVVRVISSMVISAPVLGNPKKQYSSTQVLEYSEYSKYSSTGTRVLEYLQSYSNTGTHRERDLHDIVRVDAYAIDTVHVNILTQQYDRTLTVEST